MTETLCSYNWTTFLTKRNNITHINCPEKITSIFLFSYRTNAELKETFSKTIFWVSFICHLNTVPFVNTTERIFMRNIQEFFFGMDSQCIPASFLDHVRRVCNPKLFPICWKHPLKPKITEFWTLFNQIPQVYFWKWVTDVFSEFPNLISSIH